MSVSAYQVWVIEARAPGGWAPIEWASPHYHAVTLAAQAHMRAEGWQLRIRRCP